MTNNRLTYNVKCVKCGTVNLEVFEDKPLYTIKKCNKCKDYTQHELTNLVVFMEDN